MALAAPIALAGCGADRVLLRYHPKPGATFRYALHQRMHMTAQSGALQMPAVSLELESRLRQHVVGPEDGGIAVDWFTDTMWAVVPPQMAALRDSLASRVAYIRKVTLHVVYDDRMFALRSRLADPSGTLGGLGERLRAQANMFAYSLPRDTVGKGDTWRAESELPIGGVPGLSVPIPIQTRLTVRDVRIGQSDTTVAIDLETTFPDKPLTMTDRGRTVTMKLGGSITGQTEFSVSQGALRGAEMRGQATVEAALQGLAAVPVTLVLDLHITLRRLVEEVT